MVCRSVKVENFRNIESCDVSFSDGVNILVGDNAQGKTNLLEAIYFTALGKSFRPAKEAELVRFGEEAAYIKNSFRDSIRDQNISVRLFGSRSRRVVEQNGVKISKMSELVGAFKVVLFCPEHLSLIQGGPELRRNYLNVALSQLRPVYLRSLQRYNQILKERNSLIKKAEDDMKTFRDTIDFWSEQLAAEAAVISSIRADYIRRVGIYVSDIFEDMTASFGEGDGNGRREIPSLEYHSVITKHFDIDEGDSKSVFELFSDVDTVRKKYTELLTTRYEREIAAGSSLYGIHRDDIKIDINSRPARLFASQGQQRSLALAMKLAEGSISSRESGGDMPVFLFDDVLSELDSHRRAYLMKNMESRQVIMTTCELDPKIEVYSHSAELIGVRNGVYANLR